MGIAPIKKSDNELQVAYAEVYPPGVPDSDNEYMTEEEVRKMAHKFMVSGAMNRIDTNHDNQANGSYVVESFIARKGDPDFIAGAWVVGVHIPDPEVWAKVKNNELNGFSLEALVSKVEGQLELEIPEKVFGMTDAQYGHTHVFEVAFKEDGTFLGGVTDEVDGHSHRINHGTVTVQSADHAHRFSYVEQLSNG